MNLSCKSCSAPLSDREQLEYERRAGLTGLMHTPPLCCACAEVIRMVPR